MSNQRLTVFLCTIFFVIFVNTFCLAFTSSPGVYPERGDVTTEQQEFAKDEIVSDPLEPVNRVFFAFNDAVYFCLFKPVAKVLDTFLANDIRMSIRNALYNITAPVRVVNNLLQGKFEKSGTELSRFVINSTMGFAGLGDAAITEFGIMPKEDEDFGQTLGSYGVGAGPYICWPLIGPSNLRDTLGVAIDSLFNPLLYLGEEAYVSAGASAGKRINYISLNLNEYDDFKEAAIDPYVSLRDAYRQNRISQIEDKDDEGDVVPFSGAEKVR